MLLNGYLMQRATLQRDYNEKSSEFVSLVPSTQISDLSEHLLSSKIHTFHEENTKKINIKQKELQDLQMNTKETRIEQKGKEDKEEVDVSEVDIDVEEESDVDINGNPSSHYEMYLDAMSQCGANTSPVEKFIENVESDQKKNIQ